MNNVSYTLFKHKIARFCNINHKYDPSPLVIFIARDHHFQNAYFNNINESDIIHIRVIGQRYELNDKFISVIAEIIVPKDFKPSSDEDLPKINIEE